MVLSVSPWFNGAIRVSLVQWCYPCLLGSMVLSVSLVVMQGTVVTELSVG